MEEKEIDRHNESDEFDEFFAETEKYDMTRIKQGPFGSYLTEIEEAENKKDTSELALAILKLLNKLSNYSLSNIEVESIYQKAVIPCFNLAKTCIKEKIPEENNEGIRILKEIYEITRSIKAAYYLGLTYDQIRGQEESAIYYYRMAGPYHLLAMFNLASILVKDEITTKENLKESANLFYNIIDWCENLTFTAKHILSTEIDCKALSKMAFNSLLALEEKNDPDIYKYIATCYLKGYGVVKNIESAYEIYLKLAKLGDAKFMKVLGDYYSGKIEGGAQVDVGLAAHWYFEAAKYTSSKHNECYPKDLYKLLSIKQLSHQDRMAILRYCGECAENGYGCEKDIMLAAAAYKGAANLGDEISKNYLQKRALRQQTICDLISRFSADPRFWGEVDSKKVEAVKGIAISLTVIHPEELLSKIKSSFYEEPSPWYTFSFGKSQKTEFDRFIHAIVHEKVEDLEKLLSTKTEELCFSNYQQT